jgi:hypothetical protein
MLIRTRELLNEILVVSLRTKGLDISKNTCVNHIKIAIDNERKAESPHIRGGCALPSWIEKKIAATVKELRRSKFPVFPEEVINRVAKEIRGTEYVDMLPNGIPGRGWYRVWLHRMDFKVGMFCLY